MLLESQRVFQNLLLMVDFSYATKSLFFKDILIYRSSGHDVK